METRRDILEEVVYQLELRGVDPDLNIVAMYSNEELTDFLKHLKNK